MMISPDEYYELYLKGKTSSQIMTEIHSIKREIRRLINIMESPDYSSCIVIEPNEHVKLFYTRKYLERAKTALAESGCVYKPTKTELKAAAFDESISYICKVVFSIGGFFNGYVTRTYILDGEQIRIDVKHSLSITDPLSDNIESNFLVSKKEFLDSIKDLNIGEWQTHYDPIRFGYEVLDGTQWELEIYFSDSHKPIKIYGSNSYPYNFDEFMELLGIGPFE